MGKKIWLTIHPRKFGYDKAYACLPTHTLILLCFFFYYLALQKYLTPWFKFLFISLAWLPVHHTLPSLLLVTILNTEDHNNNPRHKSWNTCVIFPSPMLIWVCSHFSAPKYAQLNIGEEERHIRVRTKVWSVNVRNLGVQHVGVWQKQIMTLKKKYNLNQR